MGYQGNPGPHAMIINTSRTLAAPPDQVTIPLSLVTPLNAAPSEVAAALGQLGINGAVLSGISTFYTLGPKNLEQLAWNYNLTASLASLNTTAAQLTAAQLALSNQNGPLSLQFSIGTLQTSPQSIPACKTSDLVNDASALAANLAAAAGMTAGPVQAMSDGTTPIAAVPAVAARLGAFVPAPVIYDPGSGITLANFFPLLPPFTAPPGATTCSLSVQFQLP